MYVFFMIFEGAERRKLKKNKSRGKSKDVGASPEAVTSEPMALIGGDVSMVTGSEMDELQAMLEEKKRQLSSAAGNWRTDAGRSDAKTDGGRRDGNVCSSSSGKKRISRINYLCSLINMILPTCCPIFGLLFPWLLSCSSHSSRFCSCCFRTRSCD